MAAGNELHNQLDRYRALLAEAEAREASKVTKERWIEMYGGQAVLDREGFEVVPCADCKDPLCHGWRVRPKTAEASVAIHESLLDRLRRDLPAIRYHLGGVGPEIKLALDDSSRQSNILVALHALDALIPLLSQPREAQQPTAAEALELPQLQIKHAELAVELFNAETRLEKAAEVIAAAEKALNSAAFRLTVLKKLGREDVSTDTDDLYSALTLIAKYKEAHGG
jgi:hypothetical protein